LFRAVIDGVAVNNQQPKLDLARHARVLRSSRSIGCT
jgi:hypothetical protein